MKTRLILLLICSILSFAATAGKKPAKLYTVKEDSLELYDKARHRKIPVALYTPPPNSKIRSQKLVIISHGYNDNRPRSYRGYSDIAKHLASHGYYVASIQHELPTDSLLNVPGKPYEVRMTNWLRGVENIHFVLGELMKTNKNLDPKHVTLMGHSNGGDMTIMFATKYPELVDKAISLDNRRVIWPRVKQPRIYSLRSSDQPADEGVLPTAEEQKEFGMKIIKLPNTIHNDMSDNGTDAQRKEMKDYILGFLED